MYSNKVNLQVGIPCFYSVMGRSLLIISTLTEYFILLALCYSKESLLNVCECAVLNKSWKQHSIKTAVVWPLPLISQII